MYPSSGLIDFRKRIPIEMLGCHVLS
jgi:hypothetical protein